MARSAAAARRTGRCQWPQCTQPNVESGYQWASGRGNSGAVSLASLLRHRTATSGPSAQGANLNQPTSRPGLTAGSNTKAVWATVSVRP